MTVTTDALDLLAGDPPRYPHVEGDFRRHPETGAPYVNHPTDTTKDGRPRRVMYGRPSSFGAALDNPFNLVKWKERQLLIGVSILEDDWESLPRLDPDNRDELDRIAARCHDAAGSHLAADRGTHIHLLCEHHDKGRPIAALFDAGEALGIPLELQEHIVDQWIAFRARLGLTASSRPSSTTAGGSPAPSTGSTSRTATTSPPTGCSRPAPPLWGISRPAD
jgi:hypothetical protein